MKNLLLFLFMIILYTACKEDEPEFNPPPVDDDITVFTAPSPDSMVIYEVNIRALSATGDFQGVIDRLGEIKALGANVIWLMPIHPVGQINTVNSPYCVQDYTDVNPEFGTLQDFTSLVEEAHEMGIAVIIDWVANHTSWDNPWIENKDWYTQDGTGNIIHPPGTNWLDVADLDYNNSEMRQAMIAAMKYWITGAGIDGFRCDAADFVPFDFWQQALDALKAASDKELILLAEGARKDHFTAGFQMNYSWDFYSKLKDVFGKGHTASLLFTVNQTEYNQLPEGARKLRFTTNHDESAWDATPMVLFNGKEGALAASVIAAYLSGVPLIYGSQEVGVTGNIPFFSHSIIDWDQNPDMVESYKEIMGFYLDSKALRRDYDIQGLTTFPDKDVLAFIRTHEQEQVLVIVNTRNKNVSFDVAPGLENTSWDDAFAYVQVILPDTLSLEAYQYRVLMR